MTTWIDSFLNIIGTDRRVRDLYPEPSTTLKEARRKGELEDAIRSEHGVRRVANVIDEISQMNGQAGGSRKKCLYIRLRRDLARESSAIHPWNESRHRYDTGPIWYRMDIGVGWTEEKRNTLLPARPLVPGSIPDDLRRGSIWSTIKRTALSPCAVSPRRREQYFFGRERKGGKY